MEDTKKQDRRGRAKEGDFELGVVRVFSNPGPDAEDRLRRLFSLLVRYATNDAQAAPEERSLPDVRTSDDHAEAEG